MPTQENYSKKILRLRQAYESEEKDFNADEQLEQMNYNSYDKFK